MRLAVLSNAKSGMNRQDLQQVDAVARDVGLPHIVTPDTAAVEPALRNFAACGVDILVINGGDGTVQSTLSVLRNTSIFPHEPKLVLLQGGTTNMIHRDVGMKGPPHRALARLISSLESLTARTMLSRPVIALSQAAKAETSYGFFFGAAAIPRAVQAARRRLHSRGLTGPIGEGMALAWLLGRLLASSPLNHPILRPERLSYSLEGGEWREAPVVLFMVTTLDRLLLGFRPVAAADALSLLTLTWPYRRLWRAVPGLLAGKAEIGAKDGLSRELAQQIAIKAEGDYFLDGEIIENSGSSPIHVSADRPAQFLRL